jgi:L-lactate dehydrogenase complex protein LldF
VPYSGPIGAIVSPNLFGSAAAQLPFASTLCGACRDICPVRIDIPRMLLHLRWKQNQRALVAGKRDNPDEASRGASRIEFPPEVERTRVGMRRYVQLARRPRLMRLAVRVGAFAGRPFARDGYLRWIPGPFKNWTRGRDFPALRGR